MSGTARSPRYECERCHDSGLVFTHGSSVPRGLGFGFEPCPACDGKSRLCGEVDEPAPETPTLDELRNVKFGGPA
jgi:hypothetical protein